LPRESTSFLKEGAILSKELGPFLKENYLLPMEVVFFTREFFLFHGELVWDLHFFSFCMGKLLSKGNYFLKIFKCSMDFFHSFVGKIIGKRIEPWTFGLKARF
jgi:hypothetical protein